MTGAPPWTKLTNLRMEANLPKIESRIKQIAASFIVQISRSEDMKPIAEETLNSFDAVGRQATPTQMSQSTQQSTQQAIQSTQQSSSQSMQSSLQSTQQSSSQSIQSTQQSSSQPIQQSISRSTQQHTQQSTRSTQRFTQQSIQSTQQSTQRPARLPVPATSWSACAARSLQAMGVSLAALRSNDDAHPGYIQPPPWEEEGIEVTLTTQKGKNNLSQKDKREIRLLIREATDRSNTLNYFTDGSVDPHSHTAGCAFVSSCATASYRLSNGSSTLQAELAAIMMALRDATSAAGDTSIQIFTDSFSSIMVLSKREITDNKHLITSIRYLIQQLKAQQRQVRFVWMPSHIDVKGNEEADAAAKEALLLPRVSINLPPSMSSLKQAIKIRSHLTIKTQHDTEVLHQSPSAMWYSQATNMENLAVPPTMPRKLSVILHRLRLGYACWEELRGDEKTCDHCEAETWTPLLHYLLECEATEQLRAQATTHTPPHPDPRMQAAAIARTLAEDASYHDLLCRKPPPKIESSST